MKKKDRPRLRKLVKEWEDAKCKAEAFEALAGHYEDQCLKLMEYGDTVQVDGIRYRAAVTVLEEV